MVPSQNPCGRGRSQPGSGWSAGPSAGRTCRWRWRARRAWPARSRSAGRKALGSTVSRPRPRRSGGWCASRTSRSWPGRARAAARARWSASSTSSPPETTDRSVAPSFAAGERPHGAGESTMNTSADYPPRRAGGGPSATSPPRHRQPWLPREDRALRAIAGVVPVGEVAARLGRSRPAVLARARIARAALVSPAPRPVPPRLHPRRRGALLAWSRGSARAAGSRRAGSLAARREVRLGRHALWLVGDGRPGALPLRVPPGLRTRAHPRPALARLRRRAPARARSLADALRGRAAPAPVGARRPEAHRDWTARRPPLGRALLPPPERARSARGACATRCPRLSPAAPDGA